MTGKVTSFSVYVVSNPKVYDVIKLLVDLPADGLSKGSIGAIVMILDEDSAYECEFCDQSGRPISNSTTITLSQAQFEVTQSV
jgi:hypothetical protein